MKNIFSLTILVVCVLGLLTDATPNTPAPTLSITAKDALKQVESVYFRQKVLAYKYQLKISFELPNSLEPYKSSYWMNVVNRTIKNTTYISGQDLTAPLSYKTTSDSNVKIDLNACILKQLTIEQMYILLGKPDYDQTQTVVYDWKVGVPTVAAFFCGNAAHPISVSVGVSNFLIVAKDEERVKVQAKLDKNLAVWRALKWKKYRFTVHKSCKPFCPGGAEELQYVLNVDHDRITLIYDVVNEKEIPTGRAKLFSHFNTIEGFFLEADRAIDWANLDTLVLKYDATKGYITHMSYQAPSSELGATMKYDQEYIKIGEVQHDLYKAPEKSDPTVALVVCAIVVALLAIIGFCVYRYKIRNKWGQHKKAKETGAAYRETASSPEDAEAPTTDTNPRHSPTDHSAPQHDVDYGFDPEVPSRADAQRGREMQTYRPTSPVEHDV